MFFELELSLAGTSLPKSMRVFIFFQKTDLEKYLIKMNFKN